MFIITNTIESMKKSTKTFICVSCFKHGSPFDFFLDPIRMPFRHFFYFLFFKFPISIVSGKWIWSIQLAKFSVIFVTSNTKGLKPSDAIKVKYSLDLVLLTSVFILMSPRITQFFLDKKNWMQSFLQLVKKFVNRPISGAPREEHHS